MAGDINSLNLLVFDWIFFILAGNKVSGKILDEYEICKIASLTAVLAALEHLEKSP